MTIELPDDIMLQTFIAVHGPANSAMRILWTNLLMEALKEYVDCPNTRPINRGIKFCDNTVENIYLPSIFIARSACNKYVFYKNEEWEQEYDILIDYPPTKLEIFIYAFHPFDYDKETCNWKRELSCALKEYIKRYGTNDLVYNEEIDRDIF